MKKILFIILTFSVFLPVISPFFYNVAIAITPGTVPGNKEIISAGSPITRADQFLDVIASVVKYTYAIFFIITVMFILFAAFNYLTGGDEPEKIKTAHQQIKYAAIAIAVALLAVGASTIIKNFLGNSDGATPSAPSEGKGQPWIPSPDYPGGPVST